MPIVKSYLHGLTAGTPPQLNDHLRAKRDRVIGWTDRSTRSNTRFLYSVDDTALGEGGWTATLTLRDCPATSDDWHRLRRALIRRMRRAGLVRAHWVVEWQRRGVPHLHLAFWGPDEVAHACLLGWLVLADPYEASPRSQCVRRMDDAVGWFQYVSKHAVRGLKHYQRSPENVPREWTKTGRMWGYVGEWPVREPIHVDLSPQAGYVFRRLVRAWRLADARTEENPRKRAARIRFARKMLTCNDEKRARVRGVSEWISQDVAAQIFCYLAERGFSVES